jgi:iron complex transport system permease protein
LKTGKSLDDGIHTQKISKREAGIGLLIVILVLTILVSLSMGSVNISIERIIGIFVEKTKQIVSSYSTDQRSVEEIIILHIRLPRVLVGVLVGASLAASGVIFQAIFKNPMASPFVTGVSSGAALGATISIVTGVSRTALGLGVVSTSALLGALGAMLLVSLISRAGTGSQTLRLLLSGLAVSYLLSAITSLIMIVSGQELHAVVSWLMGGLTNSNWTQVEVGVPTVLLGITGAYIFSREMNVMLLSDEEARNLGVEVEKTRKRLMILASATTALAVSLTGTIGFVGLMTPHLARTIFGSDHRMLIPTSAMLGSIMLVVSDAIARTVLTPSEIPVGIMTSLLGGPFFIYLLAAKSNNTPLGE